MNPCHTSWITSTSSQRRKYRRMRTARLSMSCQSRIVLLIPCHGDSWSCGRDNQVVTGKVCRETYSTEIDGERAHLRTQCFGPPPLYNIVDDNQCERRYGTGCSVAASYTFHVGYHLLFLVSPSSGTTPIKCFGIFGTAPRRIMSLTALCTPSLSPMIGLYPNLVFALSIQ